MRKALQAGLAVVVCLTVGYVAYAAVVVDVNGVGFVGKGDVQDVYGWNNAELQLNAEDLRFSFTSEVETSWECEWWTGPEHNRKYHSNIQTTTAELAVSVAYDARKNKKGQITGFNLNGIDKESTVEEGDVVATCGGADKTVVKDSVQETIINAGTLMVRWGDLDWTAVELPEVNED